MVWKSPPVHEKYKKGKVCDKAQKMMMMMMMIIYYTNIIYLRISKVKKMVNFATEQTMKDQRECRGVALLFL